MPSGEPIALPPASTSPRTSNSRLPLARSTRASPPSVVQGWPPPPMPPTTLAACSMPTMVFQRTLLPPSAAAEPASAVASNALAATLANAAGAQILPLVIMSRVPRPLPGRTAAMSNHNAEMSAERRWATAALVRTPARAGRAVARRMPIGGFAARLRCGEGGHGCPRRGAEERGGRGGGGAGDAAAGRRPRGGGRALRAPLLLACAARGHPRPRARGPLRRGAQPVALRRDAATRPRQAARHRSARRGGRLALAAHNRRDRQ